MDTSDALLAASAARWPNVATADIDLIAAQLPQAPVRTIDGAFHTSMCSTVRRHANTVEPSAQPTLDLALLCDTCAQKMAWTVHVLEQQMTEICDPDGDPARRAEQALRVAEESASSRVRTWARRQLPELAAAMDTSAATRRSRRRRLVRTDPTYVRSVIADTISAHLPDSHLPFAISSTMGNLTGPRDSDLLPAQAVPWYDRDVLPALETQILAAVDQAAAQLPEPVRMLRVVSPAATITAAALPLIAGELVWVDPPDGARAVAWAAVPDHTAAAAAPDGVERNVPVADLGPALPEWLDRDGRPYGRLLETVEPLLDHPLPPVEIARSRLRAAAATLA